MERGDQKIMAARKSATHKLGAGAAEGENIVALARAGAVEKVKRAEGDTAHFLAQQKAGGTLAPGAESLLAIEATEALLAGRPADVVEKEIQAKRRKQLASQAALADFRLFWETAARSLAGRDLLLIDAENVRGQRQLMLFDPDLLRMPIPMWRPPLKPSEEP